MTVLLILILAASVFMILFGIRILSIIDRRKVYPRRLAAHFVPTKAYPPTRICPGDLPPAVVNKLLSLDGGDPPGSAPITVTLLDLIHRRLIYVTPKGRELYFSPLGSPEGLLPYEQRLLSFLRAAAGEQCYLSLTDLVEYIDVHRDEAARMRGAFLREVNEDFLDRGFCAMADYEDSAHPLVRIGEMGVSMAIGAALGWLAGNIPLGVTALAFAAAALILSGQVFAYRIPYLTDAGADMAARYRAWGAALSPLDSRAASHLPPADLSRYAAFAAALGQTDAFAALTDARHAIADDYPECKLYDPLYMEKLNRIDYSIYLLTLSPDDAYALSQRKHSRKHSSL